MVEYSSLREANEARQKEWSEEGLSIEFLGVALAGEVGEACNIIKKLARERMGLVGSRATVAELAEELADALIYLDIIAMQEGIDLDDAIEKKFNKTSEARELATRLRFIKGW